MEEIKIVNAYQSKYNRCKDESIAFTLTFAQFKKLRTAKKCFYTKLPLTDKTFSLDRIDSSKGYIPGNVVACSTAFNSIKAVWENPTSPLTLANVTLACNTLKSLLEANHV
jgi:hypothetical protein